MAVSGSAGAKFFIGTQASDAAADTYTEVEQIENIGRFGDNREVITKKLLGAARILKAKGVANAGSFEIRYAEDLALAGQNALRAAGDANNSTDYNFKIELADTPSSGPSPAPTTYLLKGIVNGSSTEVANADSFVDGIARVEINTVVSRTAATDGS